MTDADIEALSEALHRASVEHCRYQTDPLTHNPHHQFIQMMMDREKRRKERVQKIQDYVAGSLILAGIIAAVGFLGKASLEYFRSGGIKP
jgi:hypothetical protein